MAIQCIAGGGPSGGSGVTNSAALLCTVPPGVGSVTISVAAANTTFVYVGTTSSVTATNGAAIIGGSSVTIPLYPGSKGTPLYAIGSVAGPTPVGVFISTGS
jgi:hypothetical protein